MKRMLVSTLATVTLVSGLHADDIAYSPFIGFEVGAMESNFKEDTIGDFDTTTETGFGFRLGVKDQRTRIYTSFHYMNVDEEEKEDNGNYGKLDVNQYDAVINLEAKTDPFTLTNNLSSIFFVGGHVGAVILDYDAKIVINGDEYKESDTEYGVAYGAQGGVMLEFNQKINVELGYRYTWTNLDIQTIDLEYYDNIYGAININF